MNLDALKEEIKRKRKEIYELNKKFYFNHAFPIFFDSQEYAQKLKDFYDIDKESGATLEQLEAAGKKSHYIFEEIEKLVDGVAMDLTERNVKFNTLTVTFKASPFVNKNEQLSDYISLFDIVISVNEKAEKDLDRDRFYIIKYNELVEKMKELGYEINVEKIEEMNINAATRVKITCDFTDINEEEKEAKDEKGKTKTLTNSDVQSKTN